VEEKTFELLTKIYSDFTEFKANINEKVDNLTGEVKNLKGLLSQGERQHFVHVRFQVLSSPWCVCF